MTDTDSGAFEQLSEPVQRWIWRQQWTELRDIQEQAVSPILEGRDVLISSATASGKTEAAFLPICTALTDTAQDALGVLYIAPLKALINDQQLRLHELFEQIDAPVTPWHGDINAHIKRRLVERPRGALLITPESLEAMFVTRGTSIPSLAANLQFIVVDELHAFIATERGRQLQSLLHRLEVAKRSPIPRIGLSATLGDPLLAADFLRPNHSHDVVQITSAALGREVQMQVRGYLREPPSRQALEQDTDDQAQVEAEESPTSDEIDIAQHLFMTLRGTTNLAFANRRSQVERYADLLRRLSEQAKLPNEFLPHHGSLARDIREDAEDRLRGPRPTTVIATTTLELGIDVGSVDSTAQIGPPHSVASLKQRLGRSGRAAGAPSVIRIYIQEEEIRENSSPTTQLRVSLVQTVAMIRLLLQRWVDPPPAAALHLSTLVQQVLSLIAQHGDIRAADGYQALCRTGPFASVDQSTFAQLLRDLAGHDLLTQTHHGTIVLDLQGERLVNHFDFFAAFSAPDEWRLVTGPRTLGTLPMTRPLLVGSFVIFAGRRWEVVTVDDKRRTANLTPAEGGRLPEFRGDGPLLHDRIREEMRQVYLDDDLPSYLDAKGRDLLTEARATFRRLQLPVTPVLQQGRDTWLFPWVGDRALNTLGLMLHTHSKRSFPHGPGLQLPETHTDSLSGFLGKLIAQGPPEPQKLAASVRNKRTEKHHRFLSDNLLNADYASSQLDINQAWTAIKAIQKSITP